MATLVHRSLDANEAVLLVGETGVGKTALCEILAGLNSQELMTINCHHNTETSDFIGCMRTKRGVESVRKELEDLIQSIKGQKPINLIEET